MPAAWIIVIIIGTMIACSGIACFIAGLKRPHVAVSGRIVGVCEDPARYNAGMDGGMVFLSGSRLPEGALHPVIEYVLDGRHYRRACMYEEDASVVALLYGKQVRAWHVSGNPDRVYLSETSAMVPCGAAAALVGIIVLAAGLSGML